MNRFIFHTQNEPLKFNEKRIIRAKCTIYVRIYTVIVASKDTFKIKYNAAFSATAYAAAVAAAALCYITI